jgi:aminoglycoside 6'-N-acetyltransferase
MVSLPPDAAADDPGAVARAHTAADDPRLVLRPVVPADALELRRIHLTPEVRRWWDEPAEGFPWDEPDSTRWTIEFDGRVAGLIQYWEETEPKYRHAGIDLFLDPSLHGRGLGAAAITRVVRHLIERRGHHRITIDPAVDNVAAIRCYEKVGFSRVGVMRSYERDTDGAGWHDGLLMELLSTDERA